MRVAETYFLCSYRRMDNLLSSDKAIDSFDRDLLDRGPFIESLIRTLVNDMPDDDITCRTGTGFVVGLTGKWGSGKSSIIQILNSELNQLPHVSSIIFNPWLFEGRDDLVRAFFSSLRSLLGRNAAENYQDVQRALDKYWTAINVAVSGTAAVADSAGASGAASSAWSWFRKGKEALVKPSERTPDDERKSLEQKLAKANHAYIVLIDELDRVEDSEVRTVAQLIKAIGDIQGLSYLVAYDPERVADALGRGEDEKDRRASGEAYLEKIIQYAVPIRPLFSEDVDGLLRQALGSSGDQLLTAGGEREQKLIDEIKRQISTPREIKRLVGAYSVISAATRNEIARHEVLAYSWISTKWPHLRDWIGDNFDSLIDDPDRTQMMNRVLDTGNQTNKLGALGYELSGEQKKIVGLLFERFCHERLDFSDRNRIGLRRNIVKLLYLGDPPTVISRKEIQEFYNTNYDKIPVFISELLGHGKIRDFSIRLFDFLEELPKERDIGVWGAIADSFRRGQDWAAEADHSPRIIEELGDQLISFGARSDKGRARLIEILKCLIKKEDPFFAPQIVRWHYHALGMGTDKSRSTGTVLQESEVRSFLDDIEDYVRSSLKDESLLKRVPIAEPIFLLNNTGRWTEADRDELTGQLVSAKAIATLASVITPPGYLIDKDALDQLVDISVVKERIEDFEKAGSRPQSDWLGSSWGRFKAIVSGLDPHFHSGDAQ